MANTIKLKRGSGAPGTLAAGEIALDTSNGTFYVGDGSAVQELSLGATPNSASFTAAGSIADGAAVAIRDDGKVEDIGAVTAGTAVVYESAGISAGDNYTHSVYHPKEDKTVFIYRDSGNSGYLSYNVGTVTAGTNAIAFSGSAAVIASADYRDNTAAYDHSSEGIMVVAKDDSSQDSDSFIGHLSGTTVTWQSEVEFSSNAHTRPCSVYYPTINRFLTMHYSSGGGSDLTMNTSKVVGTTLSHPLKDNEPMGTNNVSLLTNSIRGLVYIPDIDMVAASYAGNSGYDNNDLQLTVFGATTGTAGTSTDDDVFGRKIHNVYKFRPNAGANFTQVESVVCSDYDRHTKRLVTLVESNFNGLYVVVSRVSKGGIYPESQLRLDVGDYTNFDSEFSRMHDIVYCDHAKCFVVLIEGRDLINTFDLVAIQVYVHIDKHGKAYMSQDDAVSLIARSNANGRWDAASYDTTAKRLVLGYQDQDNSNYGTAIVIRPSANQRFIGFAQGSASDGGSVSVLTKGALDAKNSSLVVGGHYYLKPDGTVSLKSDDNLREKHWPYVGKALSATQIAIYNEG
jgi:hypothetical protein